MKPESALQRDIRNALAKLGLETVHVPNGAHLAGEREKRGRHMANLKRDGLRVGMADLLVYARGGRIAHLEVKTPGNNQTPAQVAVQEWLEAWGHRYAVVRSIDDALAAVRQWGMA